MTPGGPYDPVGTVEGKPTYLDSTNIVVGEEYFWIVRPATVSDVEVCQSNEASASIPLCVPVPEFPTVALPLVIIGGLLVSVVILKK
jgi:hypothetical protein